MEGRDDYHEKEKKKKGKKKKKKKKKDEPDHPGSPRSPRKSPKKDKKKHHHHHKKSKKEKGENKAPPAEIIETTPDQPSFSSTTDHNTYEDIGAAPIPASNNINETAVCSDQHQLHPPAEIDTGQHREDQPSYSSATDDNTYGSLAGNKSGDEEEDPPTTRPKKSPQEIMALAMSLSSSSPISNSNSSEYTPGDGHDEEAPAAAAAGGGGGPSPEATTDDDARPFSTYYDVEEARVEGMGQEGEEKEVEAGPAPANPLVEGTDPLAGSQQRQKKVDFQKQQKPTNPPPAAPHDLDPYRGFRWSRIFGLIIFLAVIAFTIGIGAGLGIANKRR